MPTPAIHSHLTSQTDSIFSWLCLSHLLFPKINTGVRRYCSRTTKNSHNALSGAYSNPYAHCLLPLCLTVTQLQSSPNASRSQRLGCTATVFKLQNSVQDTLNYPMCTDGFFPTPYTQIAYFFPEAAKQPRSLCIPILAP